MWRICLSVFAVLAASPSYAEERFDPKCSDDQGTNRCDKDNQAETRAKYGLEDKEALAAKGTHVRRAMFVDGYGRDVLAVSFLREKNKDPYVEIRIPKREAEPRASSIVATISGAQWQSVFGQGAYFDRELVPEKTSSNDQPICLHSWVVNVEAVDPARLSGNSLPAMPLKPEIRNKTQSACGSGLAVDYAFRLAELAHSMIPACQSISLDDHRNKVMALNACHTLSGDRVAAGNASSLSRKLSRALRIFPKDAAATKQALEDLIVTPDPNDEGISGWITQAQRNEMVDMLARGDLYFSAFRGMDADHAIIEATQILSSEDPNANNWPRRNLRMSASRETGDFRINRIDVLPSGPPPQPKSR